MCSKGQFRRDERTGPALTGGLVLLLALVTAPGPLFSEAAEGVLKVTSDPAGARVWVDDVPRGATPTLLEVAPGRHVIRLEQPGYRSVIRYVTVLAGRLHRQHVPLEPEPGKSPTPGKKPPAAIEPAAKVQHLENIEANAAPGTVTIVTTPAGLTVFMNEELIPQPTPVIFDIRPGIYEVRIEDQGETVFRRTIFVRPAMTSDLDLTIRKTRRIDYSDPWR